MKILFYLGHPAHFHLFKNIIQILKKNNHEVFIIIRKKDVLEHLLSKTNWKYTNFMPMGRKDNKLSIAWGLVKRTFKMFIFCLKNRPNIMLGYSTEITHIGKILNIPSVIVNEDDYTALPLFSKLGHPFASNILAPSSCKTGQEDSDWEKKTIHYNGYHELTYLAPNLFEVEKDSIAKIINVSEPYFIIRFAKLAAHHDDGVTGITSELAKEIINILKFHGKIYITSERELEPEFEPYRINIDASDIHHALHYADMYIGDSQTMAAEAAVLGTPSLRFNDFVGKLGYLEELEYQYGLTYGIKTSEPEILLKKIKEFLNSPNLKEEWQVRRQKMLSEKIDVCTFMVWFIENYPESVNIMNKDQDYQNKFK